MTDVAPLTPAQRQRLKRLLLRKGAEINERLTALLAGERVDVERLLGGGRPGATPIEKLRRFMKLVDDQLRRIAAGDYGTCERCASPLPFEQLEQVPWIDTCQDCARAEADGRSDEE